MSKIRRRSGHEPLKYSNLLRKIKVASDCDRYGEFCDWGYWTGTSWAGYSDLPRGYWVYVTPDWFIFEKAAGVEPGRNPKVLGKRKYGKLLHRIEVPDDAQIYGEYYDLGHSSRTSCRGHENLPAGYWVYVKPHWYIFGKISLNVSPAGILPNLTLGKKARQR